MAFKLTYKELNNGTLLAALEHMASTSGLNHQVAYNIAKIKEKVQKEMVTAREMFQKILKEHAVLDEAGQVKPVEGSQGTFEIQAEKQKTFEESYDQLMKVQVEIPHNRIPLASLEKVGLTANEIMAVEPMLYTMTAVEDDSTEGQTHVG